MHDPRLQRLLAALPASVRRVFEAALRPSARWWRLPLAVLFIVGGLAGFLPILGFWMIPIGLILLSRDLPFLRRPTLNAIGAVQRWWDRRHQP